MTKVTVVEVFTDTAGEERFRAKGGNGEIIAEGESYKRREDAIAAAFAVSGGASVVVLDAEGNVVDRPEAPADFPTQKLEREHEDVERFDDDGNRVGKPEGASK